MSFEFPVYRVPDSRKGITHSGNNTEPSLILIRNEADQSESVAEMLKNIIKAIGIDMESQVLEMQINQDIQLSSSSWIGKYKGTPTLIFGFKPSHVGIQTRLHLYTPQYLNGHPYLFAHSLHAIHLDKTLKKKLWIALKSMFNV